ncbi:MAG: DUF1508 domain-containing protein [Patescibacteria group bacterium]
MTYYIYKDRQGDWRWQLQAGNSKIIADSGEGYRNKEDCLHGIGLVKQSAGAPVYEKQVALR